MGRETGGVTRQRGEGDGESLQLEDSDIVQTIE